MSDLKKYQEQDEQKLQEGIQDLKETMKPILDRMKETYKQAIKEGQTIEVNYGLPFIQINRGIDNVYSFQEHEAQTLFDEYKQLGIDSTDLNFREWLLASSQEW